MKDKLNEIRKLQRSRSISAVKYLSADKPDVSTMVNHINSGASIACLPDYAATVADEFHSRIAEITKRNTSR